MKPMELIHELNEAVCVSDPVTYEILFLNKKAEELFSSGGYEKKKCYQLLQNRTEPCSFCKNHLLSAESEYIWGKVNCMMNKGYLLKDKLIPWGGGTASMKVGIDISRVREERKKTQQKFKTAQILLDCVRILTADKRLEEALCAVLEKIGRFYRAERVCVFEMDRNGEKVYSSYEWENPHMGAERVGLRTPPPRYFPALARWAEDAQMQTVKITDVEDWKGDHPREYIQMKKWGIGSLLAVPFFLEGQGFGYVEVDNLRQHQQEVSFLQSLSYFLVNELHKHRLHSTIEYQSSHDELTGLFNRRKYQDDVREYQRSPSRTVGIIFADVDNLKITNDAKGHEAGDKLILRVTDKLRQAFYGHAIYRVGGDEFVIVVKDLEIDAFLKLFEKAKQRFMLGEKSEISMGSAWESGTVDLEKLREIADKRMYYEKRRHKQDQINREAYY